MAETHYRRLGIAEREAERAGEPSRANAKLRTFGVRIGDAAMCARCRGDGLILRCTGWIGLSQIIEPFKCPDCKGEGLDPNVQHGGK